MKKKEFTKNQVQDIINMYMVKKFNIRQISSYFKVDRGVISRLLKEENITLRKPGRTYLGGRQIANKKWADNNKEYLSKKYKNWSSKNREHLREYHKQWREKNIEHLRETRNEYERTRKSKDPIYKLISNFRTAIWTVLKEQNIEKNGHYFGILGYSQQDLINHLDKHLNDGMTWENYGEWHVDHKQPITSFHFENATDSDFKKCWSLENLQPMWGPENISKSNHIL